MIESSKLMKDEYRIGNIVEVHPDSAGLVRTVTVAYRRKDAREDSKDYKSKVLIREKIAVQRLSPLVPLEEQVSTEDSS